MNGDGIDKNISRISIHTNEFSQWKWDNAGISRKELMTYTGKQQDDSTGLYYFNARYYDPMLGRFITEDPAKDGGNWYLYCAGLLIVPTDEFKNNALLMSALNEWSKLSPEMYNSVQSDKRQYWLMVSNGGRDLAMAGETTKARILTINLETGMIKHLCPR